VRELEFWYDFGSTYSYLTAMRIEALASASGVRVAYRPFMLGAIFKSMGWSTSPFQIFPAKGQYMVRDISRIAAERGLAFHMPETFPANGLHAARIALVGASEGWIGPFTRATFAAQFAQKRDVADVSVLSAILSELGLDAAKVVIQSVTPEIKDRLRRQTEEALERGIFGAPTFITSDFELFWGDDRLQQAVDWAGRNA
jgi:2-hydroxychromene-2-carboxylate isomerase